MTSRDFGKQEMDSQSIPSAGWFPPDVEPGIAIEAG